jgi:hypothetical protein
MVKVRLWCFGVLDEGYKKKGEDMKISGLSRLMGLLMLLLVCVFVSGCSQFSTERGVENIWRSAEMPVFVKGTTTQADVLKALGPPSQIISLNNGSAFYYLQEQGEGAALILLLYNEVQYQISYDRAVFFFDNEGILSEHAYSHENHDEEG